MLFELAACWRFYSVMLEIRAHFRHVMIFYFDLNVFLLWLLPGENPYLFFFGSLHHSQLGSDHIERAMGFWILFFLLLNGIFFSIFVFMIASASIHELWNLSFDAWIRAQKDSEHFQTRENCTYSSNIFHSIFFAWFMVPVQIIYSDILKEHLNFRRLWATT